MPLITVKLFDAKDKAALDTDIAAYKAGAGAPLLTAQRAADMAVFMDPVTKHGHFVAALAHGGLAVPASGAKTADLQHLVVDDDKLASAQSTLDAALADAVHSAVADADTSVAGEVTSATSTFAAEDVGRVIEIAGVKKTITAVVSATNATYDNTDGDFASGTGLAMTLRGAEVIQGLHVQSYREIDGDVRFSVMAVVEGELA